MKNQPAGFNFPSYSDLLYVIGFAILYQSIDRGVGAIMRPIYTPRVKSQNDIEIRERYIHKACESTSKAIVYFVQFIWGASILYETDFVPSFLFGKGSF
jgi:hypothetical protein